MKNHLLSATQIAALRKRFERCKTQILALDWVTQGSLSQSPQGNWRWTRKVKAKTATVALSDQQAELFRRAIDEHRKLEKLIDQMRVISQQVLLNSVEGPARRKTSTIFSSSKSSAVMTLRSSSSTIWRWVNAEMVCRPSIPLIFSATALVIIPRSPTKIISFKPYRRCNCAIFSGTVEAS